MILDSIPALAWNRNSGSEGRTGDPAAAAGPHLPAGGGWPRPEARSIGG
jgi:hypothetical protein